MSFSTPVRLFTELCLHCKYGRLFRDLHFSPKVRWDDVLVAMEKEFQKKCLFRYDCLGETVLVETEREWLKCLACVDEDCEKRQRFEGYLEVEIVPVSKLGDEDAAKIAHLKAMPKCNEIIFRCQDRWTMKDIQVPSTISWNAFRTKLCKHFGRPVTIQYEHRGQAFSVSNKEDFSTCVSIVSTNVEKSIGSLIAIADVKVIPYIATLSKWMPHLKVTDALRHLDVSHSGSSELKDAVLSEDLKAVSDIQQQYGQLTHEKDWVGRSPVHMAAKEGKHKAMMHLVRLGHDLIARDRMGNTPLHVASTRQVVESVLDTMVMAGRQKNNMGETPLHTATNTYVAEELVKKGNVNVNEKDKGGMTALHLVCARGDVAVARSLIEAGRASIEATDQFGRRPLHLACMMGHSAVVVLLLSNAAVISPGDHYGVTPLHLASQYGHAAIVTLLLGRGADASKRDKSGRSPVTVAMDSRTMAAFSASSSIATK